MLNTFTWVKGPRGISKCTFKHGEIADVDPFLCLVYSSSKLLKSNIFIFLITFFLPTTKIRKYIYIYTVYKFELENI